MQFIDLKAQQELIRKKIEKNIQKVLDHGQYILGPEVDELEHKLSDYVGTKFAIGVSSGTDALLMALLTYGIKPGDAILTSPFTFFATAEVILLLKAIPVFVDINPETFNIDVEKLSQKIVQIKNEKKLNLKGIIPVDIFGQPADYDSINEIAQKNDLFVIEDAAQSFGAKYKNRKTCSLSEITTTSFFPAKPLGCYGDGGMIFTDNEDYFQKMRSIRVHGKSSDKYNNMRIGINGRLDTIQAAILLAKFEIFEKEIELRQEVAQRYNSLLMEKVKTPFVKSHNISVWAQYSVLHPNRDKLIDKLKANEIPTAIYYPTPLHLQPPFSSFNYNEGDFSICEKVSKEIFSLPMHPYLKEEDQKRICELI